MIAPSLRVALLAGGGGGAKMAAGLLSAPSVAESIVVTNTGDDFEHLGLLICPDTDSVLYSLSGCIDRQRGWGRANETWQVHHALAAIGGPNWFQLGDQDIALHLLRSELLASGLSLSNITLRLAEHLKVEGVTICPASDQRLRTRVITDEGTLDFQTYFVARRCEPKAYDIELDMDPIARPSPVLSAFAADPVDCVVLGPSNPILSIGPILVVPGMTALMASANTRVAVCPIVEGAALKGPLAKLMAEWGMEPSAVGWCQFMLAQYPGFIDHWVFDQRDIKLRSQLEQLVSNAVFVDTIMDNPTKATALVERILLGVTANV